MWQISYRPGGSRATIISQVDAIFYVYDSIIVSWEMTTLKATQLHYTEAVTKQQHCTEFLHLLPWELHAHGGVCECER